MLACGVANQTQCAHTSTFSKPRKSLAGVQRALQADRRQLADAEHAVGDDRVVDVDARACAGPSSWGIL